MNKNKLTIYYSIHQLLHWLVAGGIVGFAASFLLSMGLTDSKVGFVLFGACFLSFLLQPIIANYMDKVKRNLIPTVMAILSAIGILSILSIYIFKPSVLMIGVLYLIANMVIDMQNPLLNSISVYYHVNGIEVKYNLARGVGAIGYGVSTLVLGYFIDNVGAIWMPLTCVVMWTGYFIMCFFYPKVEKKEINTEEVKKPKTSRNLFQFMKRYKWYTLSLIGFLFLAFFHAMTESYLIKVFQNLGGGSKDVGTALFTATIVEIPALMLFNKFYKIWHNKKTLYIGASFYIVRALLLFFAQDVNLIYAAQLLQCVTYVLISSIQPYYSRRCTDNADMLKSQALITAFYSLGCALGDLFGGFVIEGLGVHAMLLLGVLTAISGLVTFMFTVPKALDSFKRTQKH